MTSTSSSEEESSDEHEVPAKKIKTTVVSSKPVSLNNNKAAKNVAKSTKTATGTSPVTKKIVPLSKLGISNNNNIDKGRKRKIEVDSSSDSSSSSVESVKLTKKKPMKNIPKTPERDTKKKNNSVVVDSSSSSSSSSSSGSDSDDNVAVDKNNKSKLCTSNSKSKVDFHVSGLSENATSTPGLTHIKNGSNSNYDSNNNKLKEVKANVSFNAPNTSQGKKLVSKDKYKNVSQVFTYSPEVSKLSNGNTTKTTSPPETVITSNSKEVKTALVNGNGIQTNGLLNTKEGTKNTIACSLNKNNMSRNSFTHDPNSHVSGKTLRNRKRRQRKIELAKQERIQREEGGSSETTKPENIN